MAERRIIMAHEVETMAWANEVPWHRLGVGVDENLTPAQILRVADLDWSVERKPVQWTGADGQLNTEYAHG